MSNNSFILADFSRSYESHNFIRILYDLSGTGLSLKVLLSKIFFLIFILKNSKKRTTLKGDDQDLLISLISLCEVADLGEKESIDVINSGSLGYERGTLGDGKKENNPSSLKISRATYYKYKKIAESPDHQRKYLFEYAREGFMETIYHVKIIIEMLKRFSIMNLIAEKDPLKNQQIVNGITRNLAYYTDFDSVLKRMIEHNKIPTMEGPGPYNNENLK